jgi:hypothetical protein
MLLLEGCLHLVYLGSLSESIVKQNVLNYDLLVAYPLLLLFAVIKVARRGGGACNTTVQLPLNILRLISRRVGFYVILFLCSGFTGQRRNSGQRRRKKGIA